MSISVSQLRRTPRPGAPTSSKQTLAAAGVAAVAAAGLGFAALQSTSAPAPIAATKVKVVIADQAIARGTSLTGLAKSGALRTTAVPSDEVRDDALMSTAVVNGKIAAADIEAGTQLTTASLGSDSGAVALRLTAGQRAVTVPLDAARGMAGEVRVADRVDLYGSYQLSTKLEPTPRAVVKLIAEDVRVLRAPATGERSGPTTITVGLGPKTATEVAFTVDNGKVWVAARPAGGAKSVKPDIVSIESLLFGVPAITAVAPAAAGQPVDTPAAPAPAPAPAAKPAAPSGKAAAGPAPEISADTGKEVRR